MKVLVTGGGGFLGLLIVEQLIKEGYEVVTFSRNKYAALEKLGVEHHQASLLDYDALKMAMSGCKAVFHTAAKVGTWGTYASFYETNVTGTENVIKACKALKVSYLIFTSSPSVVYNGNAEGKDESLPYPKKFDAYYPQTKALAEQAVLKANSESLTATALRPHLIWGPRDHHFIPRLFEKRRSNKLRVFGKKDLLVDTIYVDNAASAHVQALKAMRNNPSSVGGKPYFLSQDEPIPSHEFINRLLESGGHPPVVKTMNPKLTLFIGWLFQNVFKLFQIKSEPPLTLFIAKQLTTSHWYDITAAKRDLDYVPLVSIDEGMKRLKKWVKLTEVE